MPFWCHVAGSHSSREGVSLRPERNQSLSLNEIYDGQSQTLLMTENLHAGGLESPAQMWGDPDARSCTFVLPIKRVRGAGLSYYADPPLDPNFPDCLINTARVGNEGRSPWPSPNHPGGVCAAFCDGSTKFVSEDIDLLVYKRIITPAGGRLNSSGVRCPGHPQRRRFLVLLSVNAVLGAYLFRVVC